MNKTTLKAKEEVEELKWMKENGMISQGEYKRGVMNTFKKYLNKAVFNVETPREYVN